MTTPDHPLTESRAAELWEVHIPERKTHYLGWQSFPEPSRRCFTAIIRAAFDAGREHERAQASPTEITDEMRRAAASAYEDMAQVTRPENHEKCLNAALEAVLAVATPADPHHDPRPWQDCTREDIREGDLVEAQSGDRLLVGVAHRQAENGDWFTEDGWMLTDGDYWSLRRIPAPTPPAEEVELPTEFGAVITDVEVDFEETVRLDSMVWTGLRWTYKDYSTITKLILAFTLPDGTRAIRDGQYEDGAPRFIKETTQ